jgi:Tol biopolymer transport system component
MKLHRILIANIVVVTLSGVVSSQVNNAPEARLRAAMDKETVDGDLNAAVDGYRQVISQGGSRDVAAQAALRLGLAYEKQGSVEAQRWYEQIEREFGDPPAVVRQATARLAARAAAAKGPTLRQICAGNCAGAISRDGRWLLSVNGGLSLRAVDSTREARQVVEAPATGTICCAGFSPDGRRIAFTLRLPGPTGDSQVVVVNADGSNQRTVYRGGSFEAWSSDGKRIVATGGPSMRLLWVTVANGATQAIPTFGWENLDIFTVSPDGRYIAFSGNKDESVNENVFVIAADGSGETRVSPSPIYQEPVGWSADGKYLLYSQSGGLPTTLWAVPIADGRVGGPAVLVKQFDNARVGMMDVSESGTLYYLLQAASSDIYTAPMDPVTGKVTSVAIAVPTPTNGHNASPRWSLDGRRIGYQTSAPGERNPPQELHMISLEDGKDMRVAASLQFGGDGWCWSPDGNSILMNTLAGTRPNRFEPFRVNLATGESSAVFPGAANFRLRNCSVDFVPGFSSGAVRVRNIKSGEETELYKPRLMPPNNDALPKISHDGRTLAFLETVDPSTVALMLIPSSGGPVRELTRAKAPLELQVLFGFAWSPDDRFVYFLKRANRNAPHELFRIPAAGGAEESMGLRGADIRDLDISRDGRRIAFAIGAIRPEIWAMENFLPSGR